MQFDFPNLHIFQDFDTTPCPTNFYKLNDELKNLAKATYISKDFAIVDVKDFNNSFKFIEQFDKGHLSVMLSDNGIFKGLIEKIFFRENFTNGQIPIFDNVYIEYDEDEEKIKMKAAEIFSRTIIREVPLLKDEKIVAVAINEGTIGSEFKLNAVEFPPIYWNLISDNLAKLLFGNKKILISSDYGTLSGFKKRFDHLADIEVLSNVNWFKYQNNYYDLFLYGSQCIRGGGI